MCGCSGGHVWLHREGAWFYLGGMCGFIRGHAWLHWGGMVLFGVCAWFYLGGVPGFIRGACVVLFGGACVVFSVFSDTMRYGQ